MKNASEYGHFANYSHIIHLCVGKIKLTHFCVRRNKIDLKK